MFATHMRYKIYQVLKALYKCNMSKGKPVGLHVVKMVGYIEWLVSLGMTIDNNLAINFLL